MTAAAVRSKLQAAWQRTGAILVLLRAAVWSGLCEIAASPRLIRSHSIVALLTCAITTWVCGWHAPGTVVIIAAWVGGMVALFIFAAGFLMEPVVDAFVADEELL